MMMQEGKLPQSRFAAQMACWLTVHSQLEDAIAASETPACNVVWQSAMARTSHLRHDLACHGDVDMTASAATATMGVVTWIATLADQDPEALLGPLYVLEGSKLGGTILRKCLDEAYQCGPEALSYFWASGTSPMPDFKAFKERMESALPTKEQQDRVVAAASEMFDRLTDVLSGLIEGLDTETGRFLDEPAASSKGGCPLGFG